MLPGYNHNVEYQGRTFHVQTEDSGIDNPHIISHLFEGGNILETRKCDYTNILDSEQRDKVLMSLMLNQHQALIRELEGGELDTLLDGSASKSAEEEPEQNREPEEPEPEDAPDNHEVAKLEDTQVETSPDSQPEQDQSHEPTWLSKLGTPRIIRRRTGPKNDKAKTEAEIVALANSTITQIVEGSSGIQLPPSSDTSGSLDDAMSVILSTVDEDSGSN
mgnify:CR=1 FL=1